MASVNHAASALLIEYRRVFTIVALVVVGIIMWLLISVAFPAFIRGWNLSRARRIIGDTRQMDDAIDRWATETSKQEGDEINTVEAATYLKGGSWTTSDLMGNPYAIGEVGSNQISISSSTKTLLSSTGIDWGVY
jgi:hypothetical protein